MYVDMYVHICVYMCMCICMYMYICVSVYIYAYTYICTCVWVYVCTRVGAFCLSHFVYLYCSIPLLHACVLQVFFQHQHACSGKLEVGFFSSLFMVSTCCWRGRMCFNRAGQDHWLWSGRQGETGKAGCPSGWQTGQIFVRCWRRWWGRAETVLSIRGRVM